ncbi:type II toxin-antitoxin system VapC family toxin [Brevundimonas sp. PAMC22021]|uniref:type II toxin-antitoxin system VapC family toxin n=1 Tax=Brevundimonas sp. PAMC22021 TaxID=2861285 RepID=UPI001C639ABE|nr:type II toxin-antitoxin system VapC family toxin [Brevundimonas sp. PAMC22021]QYF85983.1 type II toxin-antitoxin system VapC family toxin [Brevundimonas sp. PAMC22021]
MIAVDTSALMAILLEEPQADACASALETDDALVISTATMAEALIVAERRGLGAEMERLIDGLGFEQAAVTADVARRIAGIYGRWGKGVHAAALNFGDCFAYEVADRRSVPLLFVGEDFARTPLTSALAA